MVRFLVLYPTPDDVEAFERHYTEVHIPLAKKLPALRSYNVARDVRAVRGERFYLVAELEWDDFASLQRDFASPEGQATARDVDRLAELCPGIRSVIYETQSV